MITAGWVHLAAGSARHRTTATLAALRQHLAERRERRRRIRDGDDLAEFLAVLRQASTDRGRCVECGTEHALRGDGRVRAHGDCPGGDQLPQPLAVAG